MSLDLSSTGQGYVSVKAAQRILSVVHVAHPLVLLAFFLLTFTLRSILISDNSKSSETPSQEQVGPGGKPLPRKKPPKEDDEHAYLDFSRPRKLLFQWLSLAVALTSLGNAVTVIVHALVERDQQWWCGQTVVVRPQSCFFVVRIG